ncbi:MAG: adenylate kinase family protein [Promethearchaeati archaeon SRVP18_Atabeyarchaeia-1]
MGVVLISGTPGTGKTTLASGLARRLGYEFIDIGKLAEAEHIYLRIDARRNTKIIDEKRLAKRLEKEVRATHGNIVMASHYAEIVNPKLVDKVIVLRTRPEELRRRLLQRGWSVSKIGENLEAEIVGVCSSNALSRFGSHRTYEIDTTRLQPDQVLRIALEIFESKDESHTAGSIDWLAELEKEDKLGMYMREG